MEDSSDIYTAATEQRKEILSAETLDSDLNFAFNLQLQEAINASLTLNPSTSSPPPPPPPQSPDVLSNFTQLQSHELSKLEQELHDHKISASEFKLIRDDLHRRIHDKQVAMEIARMGEDEWEEYGDDFERPFGDGDLKGLDEEVFRVYFKGLVVDLDLIRGRGKGVICGIGVAVCDSSDELLFELRKPFVSSGSSRQCAELKALIEGLNAALALELKRVVFYCDYYPLFQNVRGRWTPKQPKVITLVNQVRHLQEKFTYCHPSFVARNDIKFAFKLSREAILSQMNGTADASKPCDLYEVCSICLEDINVNQMFSIDGCQHRYCYNCMNQHVEAKLLHGIVPKCPHENCNSELKIDSCSKFLTPKLTEMMGQRIKEALIPDTEKVYCPYPKCSALMSRNEISGSAGSSSAGVQRLGLPKKCIKCDRLFCMSCKVPWHSDISCFEYRRKHPFGSAEEIKLKSLAARNLWRQCVKCKHMIELAAGCYHMTCRCGYQFCYTCGAEWIKKKATCTCPLFEYDSDEDSEDEDYLDSDSDYDLL